MIPLIVKTDYSLLQSMITIPKLIEYLKINNIKSCAISDNNLFGSIEFYLECKKNNIKPIIGLEVKYLDKKIYLYAENYFGYQNLLKLNTMIQKRELGLPDLEIHNQNVLCVIPFINNELYADLAKVFKNIFIAYSTDYEMNNALVITKNIVYANALIVFKKVDSKYLKYLEMIDSGKTISNFEEKTYEKNCFDYVPDKINLESSEKVNSLCNIEIPTNEKYIPHYDKKIKDSYKYLIALSKKGIEKRLGTKDVPKEYMDRLKFEIDVINKMGYVDYFLIVYDYVKFAKTHDVLVGPGRGSAAGSLVAYSLGIINIDPLKYDLLFERFLNPERITMPDIDIDFEYTKRDMVIDYVKNKYGEEFVAPIITYGTLKSKQAIRDASRVMELDMTSSSKLANLVDAYKTLDENLKNNKKLLDYINANPTLKDVYKVALKIENLKRNISTHASGVVVSSVELDSVIPVAVNDNMLMTGVTMNFLETLGLLKMDFLALRNLTIIQNVLELIISNTKDNLILSDIPMDDKKTLEMFSKADTVGIFQYESDGMKNFLRKLKPSSFSDLIAAVALFRPGPMENIDLFIRRKEGKQKVDYPHESLKPILEETYGIMVYQEQIMQVLVKMANFTFAEADNIRRAMSKKKKELIEEAKEQFIKQSVENGYEEKTSVQVYDLILKFANYGFPKAHAVSYALIGYQMGYLKSKYPIFFIANLLNMSIGSEVKTKEYMDEAHVFGIKTLRPHINYSKNEYLISKNSLLLPFSIIRNVGENAAKLIVEEREKGEYTDFFNFVSRTYGKSVTRKTIESLIDADTLASFGFNHRTLNQNIDSAITYAELIADLDESLVMVPEMEIAEEYSEGELMAKELASFGFYVSNHPASKYKDKSITKIENIKEHFDKFIKSVILVENIKTIKTKNNEDMAFISGSDETGNGDFVVFPKNNSLISIVQKGELLLINGKVEKRLDKYQIIVTNLEKIK